MAFVTFQNSIPVPTNEEKRMTMEVSLLMRYSRMMSWQKALMMTLYGSKVVVRGGWHHEGG